MDWQTFLTGFAGALGGTATALLIAGTLGKGLLDQWLKKDFKRFEGKLDALASQDQTMFEHAYTERVGLIKELHRMCLVLEMNTEGFILGREHMNNETPGYKPLREKAEGIRKAMLDSTQAIRQFTRENRMYLDEAIQVTVKSLLEHCENLKPLDKVQPWDEVRSDFDALDEKAKEIQQTFKKALGVDKAIGPKVII